MSSSSSAVKRKLSGSTDGKAIKVAATTTPGTTIHTAVSGTTAGTYDEIWLWAFNSHTADVLLTIEYGGATDPDNIIEVTIPFQSGLVPVIPGLILQNSLVVKAFAAVADVVTLVGYVNSITD
ncbi:MAG: hypothetical protein DRP65_09595 [Planctomycetota bacterium]|nr:MAG: hypothetical protein DRP65_09595 [Planctomycetota bacterium]